MRRVFILLLGLFLSACSPLLEPLPTRIYLPTAAPLLTSPSLTPLLLPLTLTTSPADTIVPTDPPTSTPTETATGTPTTIPFVHIFPVQPPSAAGFADGTASHGYPATDIFAVVGTQFVAVTDGIVDFVSYEDQWDPALDDPALRGGLSVAIIGADGLRYYGSHLSSIAAGIAPGVHVTAGQLLGLVGNSGDARNTLSHVHFGISRPTTPDDWKARRGQVDPYPFLLAWKDGQNLSPQLPTGTPAGQIVQSPTPTYNLYPHVFPVQPSGLAGFSEGGHAYPATDIFAPVGTNFVAATNGTVDLVTSVDTWDPASNDSAGACGLCVRILGDDGLHYYGAHLSAIARDIRPGVWVAAGQLLGLVGNTGDARYTASHLHFEISSPNPPFTKLDPFPFLTDWRAGQNITPFLPTP